MNRELMERLGFGEEMKRIEERKCPLCPKKIDINEFRNEKSLNEFVISGMCQECQDKIFGVSNDN